MSEREQESGWEEGGGGREGGWEWEGGREGVLRVSFSGNLGKLKEEEVILKIVCAVSVKVLCVWAGRSLC